MNLVYVLGIAQDGGYPQVGCKEECCKKAWENDDIKCYPSSIALIDTKKKQYWLFDITPDIKFQIRMLDQFDSSLAGVFITHAHIGHYMGLINLGLEVMNLKNIPIYLMPRMMKFIENNPMLNQLILSENIRLVSINSDKEFIVNNNIMIKAFDVPHRNELSETVGFKIKGKKKSVIYLPDIDSWDNWHENLLDLIESNDLLFLDGTFYNKNEIKFRDISKIPHPEIKDTMQRLLLLDENTKRKIHFIHLNHTNDAIRKNSKSHDIIVEKGFSVARQKQTFNIN